MKKSSVIYVVCAGALLCGLPAMAQSKRSKGFTSPKAGAETGYVPAPSREFDQHQPANAGKEPWVKVGWQFTEHERTVIHGYVEGCEGKGKGKGQGKPRSLPPGLAKKVARGESLPPGWQKKCVVGEMMPAEVYERCRPLPPDLVVQLPPSREPVITVAVGGKVVRLLEATRQILDVFDVHVRL